MANLPSSKLPPFAKASSSSSQQPSLFLGSQQSSAPSVYEVPQLLRSQPSSDSLDAAKAILAEAEVRARARSLSSSAAVPVTIPPRPALVSSASSADEALLSIDRIIAGMEAPSSSFKPNPNGSSPGDSKSNPSDGSKDSSPPSSRNLYSVYQQERNSRKQQQKPSSAYDVNGKAITDMLEQYRREMNAMLLPSENSSASSSSLLSSMPASFSSSTPSTTPAAPPPLLQKPVQAPDSSALYNLLDQFQAVSANRVPTPTLPAAAVASSSQQPSTSKPVSLPSSFSVPQSIAPSNPAAAAARQPPARRSNVPVVTLDLSASFATPGPTPAPTPIPQQSSFAPKPNLPAASSSSHVSSSQPAVSIPQPSKPAGAPSSASAALPDLLAKPAAASKPAPAAPLSSSGNHLDFISRVESSIDSILGEMMRGEWPQKDSKPASNGAPASAPSATYPLPQSLPSERQVMPVQLHNAPPPSAPQSAPSSSSVSLSQSSSSHDLLMRLADMEKSIGLTLGPSALAPEPQAVKPQPKQPVMPLPISVSASVLAPAPSFSSAPIASASILPNRNLQEPASMQSMPSSASELSAPAPAPKPPVHEPEIPKAGGNLGFLEDEQELQIWELVGRTLVDMEEKAAFQIARGQAVDEYTKHYISRLRRLMGINDTLRQRSRELCLTEIGLSTERRLYSSIFAKIEQLGESKEWRGDFFLPVLKEMVHHSSRQ